MAHAALLDEMAIADKLLARRKIRNYVSPPTVLGGPTQSAPKSPKTFEVEIDHRITVTIAGLAMAAQYNNVIYAAMNGDPIEFRVMRERLEQIAQVWEAGESNLSGDI